MVSIKNKPPKQITLTRQEVEALLSRVQNQAITKKDAEVLAGVLSMVLWMQQQLSRAKLSIKRLKKLFGFKSESRRPPKKSDEPEPNTAPDENNDDSPSSSDDSPADAEQVDPSEKTNPGDTDTTTQNRLPRVVTLNPDVNHGRLGADDYTGCEEVEIPLGSEFDDRSCPLCLEANTPAKLYPTRLPSTVVILHSTPLVTGTKYYLERVRCAVCQTYFTAPLPDGLDRKQRYTPSCVTSIIVHHYAGGLPFKRLETLQNMQGIPLPDATQYDLVKTRYKAVIKPVVQTLRQLAANGHMMRYDDTTGRIIEKRPVNTPSGKGAIHTTVMLSEYEKHRIVLFDTSPLTAGKELKKRLATRDVDESFTTMSDASSSNFPQLEESLLAKWIICLCLAHGRRRFVELLDDGADEVQFVLAVIAKVYQYDNYCKVMNFNPHQRLQYHEENSAPLMEAMRIYLNNQLRFKAVEPNSHLGEAIIYLLKHWQGLTQFLRVAGAPIDNNLCEQAIKVFIRYRKNSLFYRTFYGATIGDAMMSVLQTAAHAGVNLFDYLNTLQAYEQAVNANPKEWLPWHYQDTVAALTHDSEPIAA